MFLAVQYYRAPFPERRYWAEDFARIRDTGIHAVQLWCLWGWIESTPGEYRYDDYDELIAEADRKGLKVILSTIGEIHPFWIHRLIPDSPMVDHMGRRVISSLRGECNVGLTPGGCTDNPAVAERMGAWLADIGGRYASLEHLLAWDSWNETRWAVNSDGHVCYCPHTLRAFRDWLDERHGGLEGLSAAWRRRYASWDDVMPGKLPGRPYTDMVEFTRFLTVRAARHARFRYDALRGADPNHFISAHCATPSILSAGGGHEQALCRGVDSDLADQLDGFGSSHFPFWGLMPLETYGMRLEAVRSANGPKPTWISEFHGGSARNGIMAHQTVPADTQQRYMITGFARAAKGIITWCWRDEVFGSESSGFGLNGLDGGADARLAAFRQTATILDRHNDLLDAYRPEPARVGVLFTPDNYLLGYAESGKAWAASEGLEGYLTALERMRVAYEVVEARHLDVLANLDVLLMPWSLIVPDITREAIVAFLKRGGRLLCEAETDSFDEQAFYRYPTDRPLMQALGVHDRGRRQIAENATVHARLGEAWTDLTLDAFATPLAAGQADVLARTPAGEPLLVRQAVGKGAAYVAGTFLGRTYRNGTNPGLEALLRHLLDDAGVKPTFDVDAGDGNAGLLWRTGPAGQSQLLWISNTGPQRHVTVTGRFGQAGQATDLATDAACPLAPAGRGRQQCEIDIPPGGFAILQW